MACSRLLGVGALCLLGLLVVGLRPALAEPLSAPPEMLADAELTALAFIDADHGWAVGDRGVIWHTSDGGRAWQLQASPTACRLESVCFLDAQHGWAAGGWTHPYTHRTTGVLLRTRNGGRQWLPIQGLTLPALKHVKFFDARLGWAAGEPSALYPSGVLRTDDGGRTWTPVPKGETAGWVAADFRDPASGVLAGRGGVAARTTATEARPVRLADIGLRGLRRIALQGPLGGWLVGEGGLALTTRDGGLSWTAPPTPLPAGVAEQIDFQALAVHGDRCWLAGSPGSVVLHSPDAGKTWVTQRTEQSAPLRACMFLDENRGWAVGGLGSILNTRDGGRTWRVQRSGGQRAALLAIVGAAERAPLDLVAHYCGNEGYLGAVEVIGRRDALAPSVPQHATLGERTHEAVVAAGGAHASHAWRFPLREPGLPQSLETVLAAWNAANDGQALAQLEEHLVRRIRLWRPEVIVTENVSPRGEDPLAHLTNQAVLAAVQKAADPAAWSDQATLAGLGPWQVKKVLALLPPDRPGSVVLSTAQLAPRLGRAVGDVAESGRSLLADELVVGPGQVSLSVLLDRLPGQLGQRDVFSGLALLPGSEARRKLNDPVGGSVEQLARMAQKRHNVQQLLARTPADAPAAAGWLGQVSDLTSGLSERTAGEILFQLATRYQQAGRGEMAADAMQLLIERHPQHPLAEPASLWLVQYHASSEVAWRLRRETRYAVQVAAFEAPAAKPIDPAAVPADNQSPPPPVASSALAQAGFERTAEPHLKPAERAGKAAALARTLERTRPELFAEPVLRFPLAAAYRAQGVPRQADKLLASLSSSADNPWSQCVAAENWLLHGNEHPPKKLAGCIPALKKPRLDGRLDDDVWRAGRAVALAPLSPECGAWPAAAVLAYDQEFLYLAASCRRVPGASREPDDRPRQHDADLAGEDRLELRLDLDRDYASWWQLSVDARGRTSDACFGDRAWNPAWYVAAGGDDEHWTLEAAIPWTELAPAAPQAKDAWAIGLQRVIPRQGLQSFSQPAAVEFQPAGMGLLIFE